MSGRRTTLRQLGRIGPLLALAGVAGLLARSLRRRRREWGCDRLEHRLERDADRCDGDAFGSHGNATSRTGASGSRDDKAGDDGRSSTSGATSTCDAPASTGSTSTSAASTSTSSSAATSASTASSATAASSAPTCHDHGRRVVRRLAVAVDHSWSRNRGRSAARVPAVATAPRRCRLVGRPLRRSHQAVFRRGRRRARPGLGRDRSDPGARR
jgi:hypothetical protein